MRREYWLLVALLAMAGLTGCHHWANKKERIPKKNFERLLLPSCQGLWCDVLLSVDADCILRDASGAPVTEIAALVGTHICFRNRTGCALTLVFDDDLFGESRSRITVENDECVNLTVNAEANINSGEDDVWPFDIFCNCGDMSGDGHTNPTVRVGEDEEEDP